MARISICSVPLLAWSLTATLGLGCAIDEDGPDQLDPDGSGKGDGISSTSPDRLLDAPFYSRSVVQTHLGGEDVQGVHEALDLTRFRNPLLKPMLALRVPRRANWS